MAEVLNDGKITHHKITSEFTSPDEKKITNAETFFKIAGPLPAV